jgi:hypothetical protein
VSGISGRAPTDACARIFLVIIILSDDCDDGMTVDDVGLEQITPHDDLPGERELERESHAVKKKFH